MESCAFVFFLAWTAASLIWLISFSISNAEPQINIQGLKPKLIFKGNFEPSSMAFIGEDDFLVLDRDEGKVHRVINGKILDSPLLDVKVATAGYRGLLGVAVGIDNQTDIPPRIFLYYTEAKNRDGEDEGVSNFISPIGNRAYRYDLVDNKLVHPKLLLDLPAAPGPRHTGGTIGIGPDNNLYISIGDLDGTFRGSKYDTLAQNYPNSTMVDGRSGILRITQDGRPVNNSLLGSKYPLNLYYAYGIRNSFGFDWDPVTAKLWDTENGPDYGDEINLVEPGFNSGWVKVQGIWEPNFEQMGATVHMPRGLVLFNGHGKYSEPEFTWIPAVAPTALRFFHSSNYGPEYSNALFVSDVNTGSIYYFNLNGNRNGLVLDGQLNDGIANNLTELTDVKFATGFGQITDLEIGPDGNLYVLSTEKNGLGVYKIEQK